MEPRSVERGNHRFLVSPSIAVADASMEPRSVERGNTERTRNEPRLTMRLQWSHAQSNVETADVSARSRSGRERFNGATLSRTWKLAGLISSVSHSQRCFNGATLSRTWKQANVSRRYIRSLAASMEPRSVERGNSAARSCARRMRGASMEPRSVERGNVADRTQIDRPAAALQWSHAQSNVETQSHCDRIASDADRFNGATLSRTWKHQSSDYASRTDRWLQWSHAQSNVETGGANRRPQLIRSALQWSHAQSNVETADESARRVAAEVLQWSHAQSNVETSIVAQDHCQR